MEQKNSKPFAITAKTLGFPRTLYTKILVVNLTSADKIAAAYVNAMWDTGAQCCLMNRDLASRLGFVFKPQIPSRGITGEEMASYGTAYIAIASNGGLMHTTAAVVDKLPCPDYSFIIGLDFIRYGTLAISYTDFETTLSFTSPPIKPIDLLDFPETDGRLKAYINLSGDVEDKRVYRGMEVIDLIKKKE